MAELVLSLGFAGVVTETVTVNAELGRLTLTIAASSVVSEATMRTIVAVVGRHVVPGSVPYYVIDFFTWLAGLN